MEAIEAQNGSQYFLRLRLVRCIVCKYRIKYRGSKLLVTCNRFPLATRSWGLVLEFLRVLAVILNNSDSDGGRGGLER